MTAAFTLSSALQVARVTRRVAKLERRLDSDSTGRSNPARPGFWAEITGSNGRDHSWKRLDFDGTDELEDDDRENATTGTENARDLNGASDVAAGVRVWMMLLGRDSSGNSRFAFLCGPGEPAHASKVGLSITFNNGANDSCGISDIAVDGCMQLSGWWDALGRWMSPPAYSEPT